MDNILTERLFNKKNRTCLFCNKSFLSAGPHNRKCKKCCRVLSRTYTPIVHKVHEWVLSKTT